MPSAAVAVRRSPDFRNAGIFGRDRGLSVHQMELPFWPKGTVKEAIVAYLKSCIDIAPDTFADYQCRAKWLLAVLGAETMISSITVETLDDVARRYGPLMGGLKFVTIGKRYDFLVAACKYAAGRKIVGKDDVPLAPTLPDDSSRGGHVLTVLEQQAFRLGLVDRFRRFCDAGFWTGQHTRDLFDQRISMLEPDHVWLDPATGEELWRGRWLRRNHKNVRCQDTWLPMEPEFRELATEWVREASTTHSLVVGKLWCVKKHFDAASDRLGMDRVRANLDMRSSFASMLAARGYSLEYIRQAQGHEGAPQFDNANTFQGAQKPTVGTRHYLRLTSDLIIRELRRRRAEIQVDTQR